MGKNKNQHYLSVFYLYNFTNAKQRQELKSKRDTKIYHYDFNKCCVKERPIEKVAIDSHMFSYKDKDGVYDHSLDNEIRIVEEKTAKAIKELSAIHDNLLKTKTGVIEMDNSIMNTIIEFMFWQVKRHPDIVDQLFGECTRYLLNSGKSDDYAKSMALDVVRNIGRDERYDIYNEFQKKNKTIVFTSSPNAQFITSDNPFVRFNKNDRDGISIYETEMYFPITSNMLLFMHGDGNKREFRLANDRVFLRNLNSYMVKSAKKYIFGRSDIYIEKLVKDNRQQC